MNNNQMPKGYKIEKIIAIPEVIQQRRAMLTKWNWLRKRLAQMQADHYYRLTCSSKIEAERARAAIKNYAARNQRDLSPALAYDFNVYSTQAEGSEQCELYIECFQPNTKPE